MDDLNDLLFTKIISVLFGVAITVVNVLSSYLLHMKSIIGSDNHI